MFRRDPEFKSVVKLKATNLPLEVECSEVTLEGDASRYELSCTAGQNVEPGDYPIELAATSYLAGRDPTDAVQHPAGRGGAYAVKGAAMASDK
ncbi:MAG: hypothetical protein R2724_11255 [Bryobacterales bacterium]